MWSTRTGMLIAASVAVFVGAAEADTVVDLTQVSAGNPDSGQANGARFFTNNQRPTGTGVIEPFLRLQRTGAVVEGDTQQEGFNTDARKVLDNLDGIWTHSLQLSDVPVVQLDGRNYLEFLLDINEDNGFSRELLDLHELQLYLAGSGDIDDLGDLQAQQNVYDLDTGPDGDVTVALKYNPDRGIGTGSGSGDLYAYIPLWAGYSTTSGPQYLYLYSLFGEADGGPPARGSGRSPAQGPGASAGFEEWAFVAQAAVIPLPASVWGGLGLLGVVAAIRYRRSLQA